MIKVSNKRALILIVLILAMVLSVVLIRQPPTTWGWAKTLGEAVESWGAMGVLIFFVVGALATSIGLPRQVFAFAAGYAYAVPGGVLLSSLAAIVGCALTFYSSRYGLSVRVTNKYPQAVAELNDLLKTDVFLKILVLRLQPLGTNLLTNLCAGVSQVSARIFLLSSWVGYLPQMFIFALLGAGVRIGSNAYLAYSASLLFLSFAIGIWLYRKTMRKRKAASAPS